MPAITVEGIILKRSNFGEADRMLTILTKNLGKISVVARGVRKITSRRSGNVELLNLVKVGLFKGKGYTLTEAQSIETFPRIKSNLAISTAAFHILELSNRFLPENQPNFRAYELVKVSLIKLEENPRQIFLRAFEVKFLSILGFVSFQPDNSELSGKFQLGVVNRVVNRNLREILAKLLNASWEEIKYMKFHKDKMLALEKILRYYLEDVLESKLKSASVMKGLKNG